MITIKMDCPPRGAVSEQAKEVHAELSKLKRGEAVVIVDSHAAQMLVYRVAKRMGIKVITRKLNGKGIGVWRTDLLMMPKDRKVRV